MSQCANCGTIGTANTQFCTHCGTAFASSSPTSFAGRPVISMDPRKQGQPVESNSQVSHQAPYQPVIPNQNLNSQVTQFQSSPLSQQAKSQGMSKNKIVFGVVGALIAIVLLVFLLGQKDSNSPSVAPSNQQSGSNSGQTSNEPAQSYSSYDDYPSSFRSEFIDSCSVEGNYEYCVCALERVEELYSYDEILDILYSGEDLTQFYEQLASYCI